jgi:transposase
VNQFTQKFVESLVIRHGSYCVFQRYLCKNCDRTFNDQTGTIFEHSSVALRRWLLAVYTCIRFDTSLRQLDVEIDVSYKMIYRRVQRSQKALDAPRLQLEGLIEINEFYVKAGVKRCECEHSQEFGICINCWWVVVNITNILVG